MNVQSPSCIFIVNISVHFKIFQDVNALSTQPHSHEALRQRK